MKFRFSNGAVATAAVLCGCLLGVFGCRRSNSGSAAVGGVPRSASQNLDAKSLGALPGAIYQGQANSLIHWQPWTKDTLLRARGAKRLVFAVIAMPQQPGYQSVLAALTKDAGLVDEINHEYVSVLIDGDSAREVGLLAPELCAEIHQGLQLPLFVWLTPAGNPVAWIPVPRVSAGRAVELFNQSHAMVNRLWKEDLANQAGYVSKNSATNNVTRAERMTQRRNSMQASANPAADVERSLRQLASFYDPLSRSFDQAGGLFPAGSVDLLATAAIHPGLPDAVRSRCLETTRELLVDLFGSAMFDPLDGGVFTSRRGNSWALPGFSRDCISQARAAVALIDAYRATGDAETLERALGLIKFAEKSFSTYEGLFSIGAQAESEPAAWLWTVEDIEKELPPADAVWWIKATNMKGLGNLPSEADPRREFFRSNSLAMSKSPARLATEQGQALEVFAPRYETVRQKLLQVRIARLGQTSRDDCSHASASFRMVSAYAAAFAVTGDGQFREKARDLLGKCRVAFTEGPRLRQFSKPAPATHGEGRAFLYGLALQAALDVNAITSDEKWLGWADDLASTAAELFTGPGYLKECPDDAKILDLPISDSVMLFDDSSKGLLSFAECRLAERDRPLVAGLVDLVVPLPASAADRPVLYTDLLQATLAREHKVILVIGAGLSPEMLLVTQRLPLRMIQRRSAKPADLIPDGSVKLIFASGETRMISTPAALQEAVLPSTPKL